jgi:hypothetical protein
MKTIRTFQLIAMISMAASAMVIQAADALLKIAPARAFPDFERIGMITTDNTGPHIHPIFDMGDVNNDGRSDLVMFEMDGADVPPPGSAVHALAVVYLGNTNDGFARQSETYVLPTVHAPRDFKLADFNGDKKLDLLLNDPGVDSILLLGNGDGTFQQAKNLALNAIVFPTPADLNGDKFLDLVAGTFEGAAMVFLGQSDGTFIPGQMLDTVTSAFNGRTGQFLIGDIDNNGRMDIAVASVLDPTTTALGNLDVFLGRGDGTFEAPVRNPGVGVWRGALGDFNGDGIFDYAGNRYGPEAVEIWLGIGNGSFRKHPTSYSLNGWAPGTVDVTDLNGDTLLDLVTANLNADLKPAPLGIFLGKGDGTFQPLKLHSPLQNIDHSNFAPKLADLNGDGAIDIGATGVVVGTGHVTTTFAVNWNRGARFDRTKGYQVTVQGVTNSPVILESSTDLRVWTLFATNTPAGDWSLLDSRTGSSRRYYRGRQP